MYEVRCPLLQPPLSRSVLENKPFSVAVDEVFNLSMQELLSI